MFAGLFRRGKGTENFQALTVNLRSATSASQSLEINFVYLVPSNFAEVQSEGVKLGLPAVKIQSLVPHRKFIFFNSRPYKDSNGFDEA